MRSSRVQLLSDVVVIFRGHLFESITNEQPASSFNGLTVLNTGFHLKASEKARHDSGAASRATLFVAAP